LIDVDLGLILDHHRRRPVNATFTGMLTYDARLPDWSPSGLAALDGELRELLATCNEQFLAPPNPVAYRDDTNLLDAELIRGFCEIQLSENASAHGMRGNPALWTGSVISLMIRDFASLDDRLRSGRPHERDRVVLRAGARLPWQHRLSPRGSTGHFAIARRTSSSPAAWKLDGDCAASVYASHHCAASNAPELFAFSDWLRDRPRQLN
jgi:hypothetical protein